MATEPVVSSGEVREVVAKAQARSLRRTVGIMTIVTAVMALVWQDRSRQIESLLVGASGVFLLSTIMLITKVIVVLLFDGIWCERTKDFSRRQLMNLLGGVAAIFAIVCVSAPSNKTAHLMETAFVGVAVLVVVVNCYLIYRYSIGKRMVEGHVLLTEGGTLIIKCNTDEDSDIYDPSWMRVITARNDFRQKSESV